MTKPGILGIDRKCRSTACARWTFFKVEDTRDKSVCPDCRRPYGRTELGLDVTRFATPQQKLPKDLRNVRPAGLDSKPKPGEYRG